jgi:hypothetical protein
MFYNANIQKLSITYAVQRRQFKGVNATLLNVVQV